MTLKTSVRTKILNNRIGSLLLLSIAPLSLNVRALNRIFAGIVRHGAAVPADGSRAFSATASNRASIRVRILRNRQTVTGSGGDLNGFRLANVPPTPHNIPRVRISFRVSTSNVLRISTLSGNANHTRDVHVAGAKNLDTDRIRQVHRSTRIFTSRSDHHHRMTSLTGRTSTLFCDCRTALQSRNNDVSTTAHASLSRGTTRLHRTVTSPTVRPGALRRRLSTLRATLFTIKSDLCHRTDSSSISLSISISIPTCACTGSSSSNSPNSSCSSSLNLSTAIATSCRTVS